MVQLHLARESNDKVATALPSGMVAVFVGATSGIGEYALKEFAQKAKMPRVYFVGRSAESADRIISECETLNSDGQYTFIQSDVSLLNNVNAVCEQILAKETSINLLFQTQGSIRSDCTKEGLSIAYVLPVSSRILFALNLIPSIQRATSLKRVVTVFAAGFEGHFNDEQWAEFALKNNPMKARGHLSSMITMANNVLAKQAPDVSFIHNYPGAVKTTFGRDAKGALGMAIKVATMMFRIVPDRLLFMPAPDCGAYQLYCATSARFPPGQGDAAGVPVARGVTIARGTNGQPGSGSYNVNFDGENVSIDVEKHLADAKAAGAEDSMWAHIMTEILNVTSKSFAWC